MTNQRWKNDPKLKNCERKNGKKCLDYYTTYKKEFLDSDPIQDWSSFERCKDLWNFFNSVKNKPLNQEVGYILLDIGTKDGQFPKWINETYDDLIDATGIEISDEYVSYAQAKNRPVIKGDVCNLQFEDESVDIVFTHHCLGLCPDYEGAFKEMMRCLSPGGYLIALNDVPGNKKKHYQYIENPEIYKEWMKDWPSHEVLYFDFWKPKEMPTEFVIIIRKF